MDPIITTPVLLARLKGQLLGTALKGGVHVVTKQLTPHDPTAQLMAEYAKSADEVLMGLCEIVIELTRAALDGEVWSFEQAKQWLVTRAQDPDTRAQLRALWNLAAEESDTERAAMLATVYLASGQTPLRSRLCLAVRSLFPDDMRALATLIGTANQHGKHRIVALEPHPTKGPSRDLSLTLDADRDDARLGICISKTCLLQLDASRCIRFGTPIGNAAQTHLSYGIELLEIGYALHEVERLIDWAKVGRQRAADVIGASR